MNHIAKIQTLQDSVEQYKFPIKTIPMQGVYNDMGIIHDIDCNDRVMIIRTDTNEYLGNHSTSYRPVTHDRIVDPIVDILDSMKTPYISQVKLLDGGAMMEAKFICKDICFEDPQKQDYIAFQITLRNSYNGMWSVMIQADGLRLWCMNGCVTPDKIANYRHNIGENKWGLYNAVTHWISHPINVSSTNKTVVERNSKMLNYMSKSDSIFN